MSLPKQKIIIRGGKKLKGTIRVSGSKHSALPILYAAASLPTESNLSNVPLELADVQTTLRILRKLGAEIKVDEINKKVIIKGPVKGKRVPIREVKKMRLSLLLLSVILSNFKNLIFPIDVGGCKLGTRKIDQHLYALGKLGVKIKVLGDKILLNREELKGTEINFDLQSTSATENALIACLNSKSTSVVITNAHLRPEILDFIHYLRKTGAKIEYNCDKSIIKVYPTSNFKPTIEHSIMGDLDEAFTYLVCAQLTHSKLKVDGFEPKFLQEELKVLERSGLKLNIEESSVTCTPVKDKDLKPFRINVGPYPKFSSDRNPIISALGSVISGQSKIVDRRFPERTQFHTELVKLGCDITSPKEGLNIIKGPSSRLTTSKVIATDIRGGAAMIILALRIQGETIIRDVYPITRGYENIELKLRKVGADIIKLN